MLDPFTLIAAVFGCQTLTALAQDVGKGLLAEYTGGSTQGHVDNLRQRVLDAMVRRKGELAVNHHLEHTAHQAFAATLLVLAHCYNSTSLDPAKRQWVERVREFGDSLAKTLEQGEATAEQKSALEEFNQAIDPDTDLDTSKLRTLLFSAQQTESPSYQAEAIADLRDDFNGAMETWLPARFGEAAPDSLHRWIEEGFDYHPIQHPSLTSWISKPPLPEPTHITLFGVWSAWFYELLKAPKGGAAFRAFLLDAVRENAQHFDELKQLLEPDGGDFIKKFDEVLTENLESFGAELKGLSEQVGSIVRRLDEEHALPLDMELVQPDSAPITAEAVSIRQLVYRNRWLPMFPREVEKAQLWEFLNRDSRFLWWGIVGEAGVGKSRLALELVSEAQKKNWRAGFLKREKAFADKDLEKWQPDEDVLVVVDYASNYGLELLHALKALRAGAISPSGHRRKGRVRVLLLDRPGAVKPLFSELEQSFTNTSIDAERELVRRSCYREEEVASNDALPRFGESEDLLCLQTVPEDDWCEFLMSVAVRSGVSEDKFKNELDRIKAENWPRFIAAVRETTDNGRSLLLQLFGLTMARQIQDEKVFDASQKPALMREMLEMEVRTRWGLRFGDYDTFTTEDERKRYKLKLSRFQRLVALVTLCRGIDLDGQLAQLCELEELTEDDESVIAALIEMLGEKRVGAQGEEQDEKRRISPFEPDLLAEQFVLMNGVVPVPSKVSAFNKPPFEHFQLLKTAMQLAPGGVAGFITLATRDFPHEVAPMLAAAITLVPEPEIDMAELPDDLPEKLNAILAASPLSGLWGASISLALNNVPLHSSGVSKAFLDWGSASPYRQLVCVAGGIMVRETLAAYPAFLTWLSRGPDTVIHQLAKLTGPSNPICNHFIAASANNAVLSYGKSGQWEDLERWGKVLAELTQTPEVQHMRGQAAFNAMTYYGKHSQWEDLERWGKVLAELTQTPEVQLIRAIAANNAVMSYGEHGQREDLERWGQVLLKVMPTSLTNEGQQQVWSQIYRILQAQQQRHSLCAEIIAEIERRFGGSGTPVQSAEQRQQLEVITVFHQLVAGLPETQDSLKNILLRLEAAPDEVQHTMIELLAQNGLNVSELRARVGLLPSGSETSE